MESGFILLKMCTQQAPSFAHVYAPDLFCGGLGTSLELLGVVQVQEEVKVTGLDPEGVDRGAKGLDLAVYRTTTHAKQSLTNENIQHHSGSTAFLKLALFV